jgi:hypothetical protein
MLQLQLDIGDGVDPREEHQYAFPLQHPPARSCVFSTVDSGVEGEK